MKLLLSILRSFSTTSYLETSNRFLGEPLLTGSLYIFSLVPTTWMLAGLAQRQLPKFSAGKYDSRLDGKEGKDLRWRKRGREREQDCVRQVSLSPFHNPLLNQWWTVRCYLLLLWLSCLLRHVGTLGFYMKAFAMGESRCKKKKGEIYLLSIRFLVLQE